jgi:hypothetical protein
LGRNTKKVEKKVMKELNVILSSYQESKFFEKYHGTYFSDKILNEVFKCGTYEEIYRKNIEVMNDFIELYINKIDIKDNENIYWKMVYAFYIDPDSKAIKRFNETDEEDVVCTADGLFSLLRIYRKYGLTKCMVSEYEQYRKVPIFFFPQERYGINQSRCSAFGDRIDHTLFDLKNYFEKGADFCRLGKVYQKPKTSKWLESFKKYDKPFEKLVNWYGVQGIFVNDQYEVIDIEKGNGEIINDYEKEYEWKWSDVYYDNLKKMVDKYYYAKGI